MGFLLALKSKIGIYAVAIGGFLLAIFAYGRSQKNKGRKEVQGEVNAKTKEVILDIVENKNETREEMAVMSDDDILDELLTEATDRPDNK